jgi:hypothetical protein
LDEDGRLGQHTLEAIKSYLSVVDSSDPEKPFLKKDVASVKTTGTSSSKRLESKDADVMKDKNFDFEEYRTDAK